MKLYSGAYYVQLSLMQELLKLDIQSEEANFIRNEMDAPLESYAWHHLTEEENKMIILYIVPTPCLSDGVWEQPDPQNIEKVKRELDEIRNQQQ